MAACIQRLPDCRIKIITTKQISIQVLKERDDNLPTMLLELHWIQ